MQNGITIPARVSDGRQKRLDEQGGSCRVLHPAVPLLHLKDIHKCAGNLLTSLLHVLYKLYNTERSRQDCLQQTTSTAASYAAGRDSVQIHVLL